MRRATNIKTFAEYNLLHSKQIKMIGDSSVHILYPIKENKDWYNSIATWSSYCDDFKRKKPFNLIVDLPNISDKETISFLKEHAWHDWVDRNKDDTDLTEALTLLRKVFPDKKPVYFYEIDNIIHAYCYNAFNREDNVDIRKYYNYKYNESKVSALLEVEMARNKWTETNGDERKKYLKDYHELSRNICYENYPMDDIFNSIGAGAVIYPVAFTHSTADWSKEKYGKLIGYAHAGEIIFVITAEEIFFEVKRHF